MKKRVSPFIVLILLLLLAGPGAVRSEDQPANSEAPKHYLYQWTDNKGTVHITDGLGKIPERYRDKARKMESVKGQEPSEKLTSDPVTDEAREAEEEARAEWQYRMREWKKKLSDAERERQALQHEKDKINLAWGSVAGAPLEYRQRAADIDRRMAELQEEAATAKDMITTVLPDEARRAGVPPGWLRE